jgi:hypothetical protein
MDFSQIAQDLPPLTNDDYDIEVKVINDSRLGTLYIPRESDLRRDYDAYIDEARQALKDNPEESAKVAKSLEERRDNEIRLYARVLNERAADIRTYAFRFKAASVTDVEEAERLSIAPASPTSPGAQAGRSRNELTYRRILASRTFKQTNLPSVSKIEDVRSDIGLHVLAEVSARVQFRPSILDFLS